MREGARSPPRDGMGLLMEEKWLEEPKEEAREGGCQELVPSRRSFPTWWLRHGHAQSSYPLLFPGRKPCHLNSCVGTTSEQSCIWAAHSPRPGALPGPPSLRSSGASPSLLVCSAKRALLLKAESVGGCGWCVCVLLKFGQLFWKHLLGCSEGL